MGSDESHFNVSLIVRDKVTRRCPQTTIFEEKAEPKRIRTEVPLLTSRCLTTRPNRPTIRFVQGPTFYTKPPIQFVLYLRAQELCESRSAQGGRPGLPVPNSPDGICGRKATLNQYIGAQELCECRMSKWTSWAPRP